MSQQRIASALDTGDAGTPFSRIKRLTKRELQVDYATGGDLAVLKEALSAGIPPVVAVHGAWLPYAQVESPHAAVLVGLTAETALVLDPAAGAGSQAVAIDAFLATWIEMDCAYAVIKQQSDLIPRSPVLR